MTNDNPLGTMWNNRKAWNPKTDTLKSNKMKSCNYIRIN